MKYIFLDIDGTLLGHAQRRMSKVNINALKQAKENGHKLFVATGRPINHAKDFLDLEVDGFIFSAGAHVMVNNQDLYEKTADLEMVHKLLKVLDKNDIRYQLDGKNYSYTPSKLFKVVAAIRDVVRTAYQGFSWSNKPINKYIKHYHNEPIHKVLFYLFSKKDLDRLVKKLPAGLNLVYNYDSKKNIFVEIMFDNCTKATGVDVILNHFGADLKDTIAIGDSMNDLEMVEHCQIGVAMGNAVSKLKEVADYVSDTYKNDGVAKALEKFDII
ncbi:MAG: HAD family hydrolase [Erysipelotrichaceae bacterium]